MAVAIAGTPAAVNDGGSYTAEAGSNRLVVWTFGAMKSTENPPVISGVTFGGVAMSLAVTSISAAQAFALTSVWYLKDADIPSGSQALVISWSVEPNDTTYLGRCYTLTGVDQTSPLVDTDGAVGSSVASLQGGGLTVEAAGVVIAHASKSENTDNFNTPSGYTKTSLGNYGFSGHSVVYDRLISGAGTESPSVTFTSANASLSLASFRQVASGSPYSLTCAQGSYALTGQAANLFKGSQAACDQGAYALTGQAATLVGTQQTLACAQGSYTLLGSTALVDIEVDLEQGSYALTGQALGLLRSWVATLEQGVYALTGRAVSLLYSGAPSTAVYPKWLPLKIARHLPWLKRYNTLVADAIAEANGSAVWARRGQVATWVYYVDVHSVPGYPRTGFTNP